VKVVVFFYSGVSYSIAQCLYYSSYHTSQRYP